MKRTAYLAAACLCAAINAGAQNPTTTTSSTADNKDGMLTVSGCLQGGPQSSASTSSTTAGNTSNAMGHYMLMTSPASDSTTTAGTTGSSTAGSAAAGTAGTTGGTTAGSTDASTARSNARMGASWMLDGRDSELKNHVGHRIEVTGTAVNNATRSNTSDPTATTTSGSASTGMSDTARTLRVSSIKMIAADCSAK